MIFLKSLSSPSSTKLLLVLPYKIVQLFVSVTLQDYTVKLKYRVA